MERRRLEKLQYKRSTQLMHFSSGFPRTKDATLFYYFYYIFIIISYNFTIYIIYKKIHLQLNCCLKVHSCMYVCMCVCVYAFTHTHTVALISTIF